jgi:hypothetical protein
LSYLTNPYRFSVSQHYSTDFSTTAGWSTPQTHVSIDTTAEQLDFDLTDSGTDEVLNYDLSSMDVSNEEWLLRYEFVFSTLNANGVDANNTIRIGLFSNSSPSGIYPSGDTLYYGCFVNFGFANILASLDNGSETKSDVNNDPFNLSTTTGFTFYIETKRVSTDLLEQRVYSTSDYSTTQVGTTMTVATSSSVNNTQFLTVNAYNQGTVSGSGYTGFLNQLDFWNGVTTPP